MNSKQKLALGMGFLAAILLAFLHPWIGKSYALSLPNFKPLISWGVMDVRIGCDLFTLALLVVAATTGIAVIMLKSKNAPGRVSDNTSPIPDP